MTLNSIAGSASRNLRYAPHVVNARSYPFQRAAHLPVLDVATPAPRRLDLRTTKASSELPPPIKGPALVELSARKVPGCESPAGSVREVCPGRIASFLLDVLNGQDLDGQKPKLAERLEAARILLERGWGRPAITVSEGETPTHFLIVSAFATQPDGTVEELAA